MLLAAAATAPHGGAHGGIYRGPGSTMGPGGATAGGPSTGGAGAPDTDPAAWDQWWSFNRDRYLALEDAVFEGGDPATGSGDFFLGKGARDRVGAGLRPDEDVVRNAVVPALLAALVDQDDADVITGVLLALAKIGDPPDGPLETAALLRPYLAHSNQEVHESAAIALGILAQPDAAPLLADLMMDTTAGRAVAGRKEIPQRTRAFAAYGLGLVGARADAEAVRRFAVHELARAAVADAPSRDLAVAAIVSLGLVRLDGAGPHGGGGDGLPRVSASREGQLQFLLALWRGGDLDDRTRAHLPVPLTRLADGADASCKRALIEELAAAVAPRSKEPAVVRHGALLALGRIADDDLDPEDRAARAALAGATEGGDRLGRNLALLGLARAAARKGTGPVGEVPAEVRARLLRHLSRGSTTERPWAALALGLLEHGNAATGQPPAEDARRALHDAFGGASPMEQGALAIALGLVRHEPAEGDLIQHTTTGDENVRGYAATALGLMECARAAPTLADVVARSTYQPGVLREAAIALALLGDKSAVPLLVQRLDAAERMFEQVSLTSALGFIGDARSVAPLVAILRNESRSDTTRAFAAVALGMICDKESLPWNSAIAEDVLWWQAPPTLHDPAGGKGILDTL